MERDIIFGIHSIAEALENPRRRIHGIFATRDGLKEFSKKTGLTKLEEKCEIQLMDSHKLQERAKALCDDMEFNYQRVPSQIFLLVDGIEEKDLNYLFKEIESGKVKKLICLDQVSDAHNGAAIMRTAAFYGVDAIIISTKGNFGRGPSFSRIASGAVEYLPIVQCASLPKALQKLMDKGISVIGFSEHSTKQLEDIDDVPICLVFGAEDVGMSNAVSRVVKETVSLVPQGPIKSLNVSVAAAVAMEKFFSK
ncbi:MAG: RNA methyltransferase [Bacteriovoracaceae bacterium]|nr:RNA methyltransferase [Bacteriovoracaceae bacterium]